MTTPGTPASAPARPASDEWLAPVRRGVLLAGGALGARWLLSVFWVLTHTTVLEQRQLSFFAPTFVAVQVCVDAALAGLAVLGVFWLTSRGVPHVSTRRWPLRVLVVADLGLTLARAVSFLSFSRFEGGALMMVVHVAAAVALLARLGELCDAGHERVAATWARSGALLLVAISFAVGVVSLVPAAQVTGALLGTWAVGVVGFVFVTVVVTLRSTRWM